MPTDKQVIALAPTPTQQVALTSAPAPVKATTIPVLDAGQPLTKEYVKLLDSAIKSDGCTGVKDYYRDCCVIHDLAYRGAVDPWGVSITRAQADTNLRLCIQSKSRLGVFSPLSWVRYAGVSVFGRFFYKPTKK